MKRSRWPGPPDLLRGACAFSLRGPSGRDGASAGERERGAGLGEHAFQAAGPLAQPFAPLEDAPDFDLFTAGLAPRYCNFRKTSIYAGSNEIQRNIISKMTLGL